MAKKSAETGKGKATPAKAAPKEEPRITKKSIIIDLLSKKGGATIEQMGEAITKAGLGDLEQNLKTARLWLPKIGFPVTRDKETNKYSKA